MYSPSKSSRVKVELAFSHLHPPSLSTMVSRLISMDLLIPPLLSIIYSAVKFTAAFAGIAVNGIMVNTKSIDRNMVKNFFRALIFLFLLSSHKT